MEQVEDRLAALEAELAALRAQVAAQPARAVTTTAARPATVAEEVNRRALLRKTGVAIAGAAAGGLVLAGTQASPAGAADGAAVLQGQTNSYTSTLTLATASTNPTLVVEGRANFLNQALNGPAPLRVSQQFSTTQRPLTTWGDTGSLATVVRSDQGADLWFAHAGTDKTTTGQVWGRVLTSATANFLQFLTTPSRLVNTRNLAKPADNSTTEYVLTGAPANAVGFVGTITATDTTADGGYVSVYNGDLATIASPQFSNINVGNGQTVATGLTVGLGASKKVKVYCFKSCTILIDVAAWVITGD
jgi:hypothetical protein